MNAAQQMTKARSELVMGNPFFGSLALRLRLRPVDEIPTACIDGRTIFYNPKFVEGLTIPQTMGLITHEIMHVAFLHHTRRQARKPMKWNMACDYAINPILSSNGFHLPEEGLNDPKYANMPAEQIYNLLPDIPGDGQHLVVQLGMDGSGTLAPDPGKNGAVGDSQGKTEGEIKAEENDWKVAVKAAEKLAKDAGKLPAGMERMIDDLVKPVLPWREILRRFMTERDTNEFTWSKPNRRLIASGLYLPSRYDEDAAGEMVVCIDTSGSVGEYELNEFAAEMKGIHKDVKPRKLHVVYCDAGIGRIDEFGRDDELTITPNGGGGTDFRPVFKWVEKNGIDVKALVYLTDGYGPFPDEAPGYPVMWAINNEQVIPPWGEHLVINEKE